MYKWQTKLHLGKQNGNNFNWRIWYNNKYHINNSSNNKSPLPRWDFTATVRSSVRSFKRIFFLIWYDSCGQFFHAACLDVPFAETWGDRDTNTTFHLPFASKIKFSSRVHLLNKIGKKHFERKTELFERLDLLKKGLLNEWPWLYLSMVNTLALTWLFLEAQCFLTCLFHVKWGDWIYIINTKRTTADGNLKFLI